MTRRKQGCACRKTQRYAILAGARYSRAQITVQKGLSLRDDRAHHRPDVQPFTDVCCHPRCFAPVSNRIASQVPLCEVHIFDVYKSVNRLLAVEQPQRDEYALLPSEQQQIPGPCPSCGIAGYLALTLTERVHCLNASCNYRAHVAQFETVRRALLFDLAADSSVVYYIKFRDCVKIGTSSNLKNRWSALTATELLYGFEYGGRKIERRRHDKFAMYRAFGEWFHDNAHIRAHINEVCATR